jgi:CRP/FNR family cyclic AMP-dependent transcriptional regulator
MRLGKNTKVGLISRVPLFAGCSKRELGLIAGIADEIVQPAGTKLTTEGARGREFCVLVSGAATVSHRGQELRTLGDGDFFGEISLLLDAPRSATVTATSDTRLLVIDKAPFQRLLREVPGIQSKLLEALATRLAAESL